MLDLNVIEVVVDVTLEHDDNVEAVADHDGPEVDIPAVVLVLHLLDLLASLQSDHGAGVGVSLDTQVGTDSHFHSYF